MAQIWLHGTRKSCVDGARKEGFRQRDLEETAKQVADTTGVPLQQILDSPEYGQAAGSFAQVGGGVSVTQDFRLAEKYANTGSGTLSDLLTAAHRLSQSELSLDDFLAAWLRDNEPRPAIVQFEVEGEKVRSSDGYEGAIDFDVANSSATLVLFPDDDTDEPW